VKHNREVERNEILLKRDARDARIALDEARKDIKLPKQEQKQVVQADTQPTAQQLEQGRLDWEKRVDEEVKLTDYAWKVGDKETGYEDVSYTVSETEKKESLATMRSLNNTSLFAELGWIDKDGKQDLLKLAGDVRLLKSIKQVISSVYTQGKTAGTKGTAADIKNIDLRTNSATSVASTPPDIGMAMWGHLNK